MSADVIRSLEKSIENLKKENKALRLALTRHTRETLAGTLAGKAIAAEPSSPRRSSTGLPLEVAMLTPAGELMVSPSGYSEPHGVSYVRFVKNEVETASFDSKEWSEDPEGVMGAIIGGMLGGTDPFAR